MGARSDAAVKQRYCFSFNVGEGSDESWSGFYEHLHAELKWCLQLLMGLPLVQLQNWYPPPGPPSLSRYLCMHGSDCPLDLHVLMLLWPD